MNKGRRKLARDDVDDAFIRRLVILHIEVLFQYKLDQKMFNFLVKATAVSKSSV